MENNIYDSPVYWEDLEETYQMTPMVERIFGKKVLITGARGMIGSFLTDFLIYCNEKKGGSCEIFAAGRNPGDLKTRFYPFSDQKYFHVVPYNLEDEIPWNFNPDYVIHGAGDSYPAGFMKNPVKTVLTSVTGIHRLLNYTILHGCSRFLYLSSGEVYGLKDMHGGAWTEESQGYINTMSPRSCYPLGKLAAENVCASFGGQNQMDTLVARLCHIYGPTAVKEDQRVASVWFRNAVAGNRLVLKSNGLQKRSYCYVADCASGILTVLLCGNPYGLYNVASDSSITIVELAESIGKAAGVGTEFQMAQTGEMQEFNPMLSAVLSACKLSGLGWCGRYSLDRGIRHVLRILKESGEGE